MIRGDGGVGSGPDADLILALGVHHHAGARGGKVRALGNAGHVHARGLEVTEDELCEVIVARGADEPDGFAPELGARVRLIGAFATREQFVGWRQHGHAGEGDRAGS